MLGHDVRQRKGVHNPASKTIAVIKKYFMSPGDLTDAATAIVIGAVLFVVGMRFGLFHLHAPKWFGVDHWYQAFARGFLNACAIVEDWYGRYLAKCSRTLLAARLGFDSTCARTARSRRRFIVTILTGAPGPRNQRFIQAAYITLERERQSTVRCAVTCAHAPGVPASPRCRRPCSKRDNWRSRVHRGDGGPGTRAARTFGPLGR